MRLCWLLWEDHGAAAAWWGTCGSAVPATLPVHLLQLTMNLRELV